jgi:3-dehydroquinate dehydratase/shikimate dehydrogenase
LFTWATALPPGERIIVGMGEYGVPSRVLAERIGSCIAYTSALSAGLPGAAPGHLDPIVLEQTFRFHELGHGTAVYALGGGPGILASKTQQLHNLAFAATGIDAVYVPIPADNAADFLLALEATNAHGAAIAVPLNEALIPDLARRSPEVDDIGACNTIVRERDGWTGYDTDASGFERALLEFMGDVDFGELRATIVGAGGVAKAIAHVLARLGVHVVILNRTVAKARFLAQRYCFGYGPCTEHSTELIVNHSDMIIQATSVGMEGERQGDPLDWYDFSGHESVFDLICRPERSMLLERALTAGCKTTNGWKMLRYQSAAQFALWTGREPPASYFS